jgi:hypothetical protein
VGISFISDIPGGIMAYRDMSVVIRVNVDENDEADFPGIAYDPEFLDNLTTSDMRDILRSVVTSDIVDFEFISDKVE